MTSDLAPDLHAREILARTAPGELGERMLGGGDKGDAGPRRYPHLADKYAVHVCNTVDGATVWRGL